MAASIAITLTVLGLLFLAGKLFSLEIAIAERISERGPFMTSRTPGNLVRSPENPFQPHRVGITRPPDRRRPPLLFQPLMKVGDRVYGGTGGEQPHVTQRFEDGAHSPGELAIQSFLQLIAAVGRTPECEDAGRRPHPAPQQPQSTSRTPVPCLKNSQHEELAIRLIKLLGRYAVRAPEDDLASGGDNTAGVVLRELRRVPAFRRAFEDQEFRRLLSQILSPAELIECAALVERAIAQKAAVLGRSLEEAEATQVAQSVGVSEVKLAAIKELVWGSGVNEGSNSVQH